MNSMSFPGARWWKFDFHSHTPASSDYQESRPDGNVLTPVDWLKAYMQAGIDCVAVTDHNSGDWIDKLKIAYQDMRTQCEPGFRELFIFPGVEITVQSGIHLLAIFDTSCQGKDITTLLCACGFQPASFGKTDDCTSKSFTDVATEITKLRGIAVPAHVDNVKGLFYKPDGNTFDKIFKSNDLFCCEVVESNSLFPEMYRSQKVDWTKVYGSDAHKFSEIGRRLTWVKMGEPNLEGLKLALIDGENFSIRKVELNGPNPNEHANFIIRDLEITNARFCGKDQPLSIQFSPWMNAIVGGRGTGKSSLIEFLRIVMRRDNEITKDADRELKQYFEDFNKVPKNRDDKGMICEDTMIAIRYCKNTSEYELKWNRGGTITPIQAIDDQGNVKTEMGDIPSRFPVRIYSQKQLFKIASNPQALLNIIDEALEADWRDWQEKWKNESNRFLSLRAKIRELEEQKRDEPKFKGELSDILKKIEIFENKGHGAILKKFEIKENQAKEIDVLISSLKKMKGKIAEITEIFEFPVIAQELFDQEQDKELLDIISQMIKGITGRKTEFSRIENEFAEEIKAFETNISESDWSRTRLETKVNYDKMQKELEEAGVANPGEYGSLIQQKQVLGVRLKSLEEIGNHIADFNRQAEVTRESLFKLRVELTEKRKAFVNRVLSQNSYVRINVRLCEDSKSIEKEFRDVIGREEGFNDDILSTNGERGLLADLVKGFTREKLTNLKENIWKIKKSDLSCKAADTRFISFIQKLSPETFDRLDLWYPSDGVEVSYSRNTGDKKFTPISQGSPGQKTAAILAFILSYGEQPIILDQPEDDLDNHLIYDLVVQQLKENKLRRQVIVVTHNPNIVINGDAEKIFALDFSGGQFRIKQEGCLQENSVRTEVCRVMEGGKIAFKKRFKRLNVENIDA
ncbi:MAG: AAA family ATPase [Acidobacteria bacterium]|nr:AAA family ATPase [Acidobacteriota bacterium]